MEVSKNNSGERPYVSVIIPAFNEAAGIRITIEKISTYFSSRNISSEIIVVDDGSTDGTSDIVRNISTPGVRLIAHHKNLGKGAAVKSGMTSALGKYCLFIDADLQISIDNFDKFLPDLEGGQDVVIGSTPATLRMLFDSRHLLGAAAKTMIAFVMGWRIKDSQRGFKVFSRRAADIIFPKQTIMGWGFDIELLAIAQQFGLKIKEVPIIYGDSLKSRVTTRSYMQAFRDLFIVKRNILLGKYGDKNVRPYIVPVILLFILSTLIAPIVFSDKIFLEGDEINFLYPYFSFHQNHIGENWNPNMLSGFPVASTPHFGFFHPLYGIVSRSLGFLAGYHILLVFNIYFTIILTYFFDRNISISREGSLLSAVSLGFGQSSFWWLGNIAVMSSFPILPGVFLSVKKILDGRWGYIFLIAPLVCLAFLGGHPQWTIYFLTIGGVYSIFMAWQKYKETGSYGPVLKSLLLFYFAVIAGALAAYQQLLYSWRFASLSDRSGGVDYTTAIANLAALPADLIRFILPAFNLRYVNSEEFLAYIGFLPLIFTLLAIFKLWKKNKNVLFFSGVIIFCIAVSMKYSPLGWVLYKLPILSYFRGLSRLMTVGSFSMAVLAGFGFDYAIKNRTEWRDKNFKWFKIFLIIFVTFILSGNAIYFLGGDMLAAKIKDYFDSNLYEKTTHLPLEYYHELIDSILKQSFDNISFTRLNFVVPFLSAIAGYFALRYGPKKEKPFVSLVLCLVLINVPLSGYLRFNIGDADMLRQKPELARIIKEREAGHDSYRVFSFLIGFASSEKNIWNKGSSEDGYRFLLDGLAVNTNLYWDISSIDGFDTIAPRRGQKLLAYVGSASTQVRESALVFMQIPLEEKIKLFTSRLNVLSMMNVKYLVSPYELPANPGLKFVHTALSTKFNVPIYLYENVRVLPRIYLANGIMVLKNQDESKNFDIIINSANDFSKITYLECEYCEDNKNIPSKKDKLIINTYQDEFYELGVSIDKGRWLIFSESNLPGWVVTIDGQPATIVSANYVYMGVYIPKGEHNIKMKYEGLKWRD